MRSAAFLLFLLLPLAAAAHNRGVSYLEADADGARVRVALAFHADELGSRVELDANGDGLLEPADLEATRGAFAAETLDLVGVSVEAGPCVPGAAEVGLDPLGGVRIAATFACPGPTEAGVDLALGHLDRMPPGHKVLGRAKLAGVEQELTADASTAHLELRGQGGGFLRFFLLGLEHIVTGYDHLLFLAALLLVATGLAEVAALVTSFTLAHSLTLGLAVTGIFELPGWLVEPAIAASIVVVAVENIVRRKHGGRPWLTFAFGLIHGFGFAGLLQELGLGKGSLAATLGGFNLGVEAGQLAVVLLVAPLLLLARRRPWYGRVALPGFSAVIGFFGAYWLVERLLG